MYDRGVFERAREAIQELDVPVDGAALAELVQLLDVLTAKVVEAVGEFDAARVWEMDGATSMTAWLRAHACRAGSEAKRLVDTACALRRLPVAAAAFRDGAFSFGQVQAVVANVSPRTVERFAADEEWLVPLLAPLTVTHTATAMQRWKARVE